MSRHRLYILTGLLCCLMVSAISLSLFSLEKFPSCFDFDAAAEAAYVNNLTVQGEYDYGFRDLTEWPASSSVLNAARRLPFSIVMSWVQQLIGSSPFHVDIFFKGMAALMGLGGILCAVHLFSGWIPRLFIIGFSFAHPAFLLYIRTGFASVLSSFLLFWICIYLFQKYLTERRPLTIYIFAIILAYFALVAHPPLATLPLVLLFLWLFQGRDWSVFKSVHPYLAILLLAITYFSFDSFAGNTIAGDYTTYRERSDQFTKLRSKTISYKYQWKEQNFTDKIKKYLNQHARFKRDDLGESTREDELWIFGDGHSLYFFAFCLSFLGILIAILERRTSDQIFLAVFFGFLPLFFTLSFPEGRYIIQLIPCYGYFFYRVTDVFIRHDAMRYLFVSIFLALLSSISYQKLVTQYDADMNEIKICREAKDMKSFVGALHDLDLKGKVYVTLPVPVKNKLWNAYVAYSQFQYEWLSFKDFLKRYDSEALGTYVVITTSPRRVRRDIGAGKDFKKIKTYKAPNSGLVYSVLVK